MMVMIKNPRDTTKEIPNKQKKGVFDEAPFQPSLDLP
jgi:hypothetical protein